MQQLQEGSIFLKFLVDTRLKSKSFWAFDWFSSAAMSNRRPSKVLIIVCVQHNGNLSYFHNLKFDILDAMIFTAWLEEAVNFIDFLHSNR